MKLKKPLLPILLISLLALTSLQAQETTAPSVPLTDSLTRYGLESGKCYPAEVVAQLLDAAIEEGRKVVAEEVKKAWNEGYKAGVADFAPGSAYWESYSASLAKEAKPGPTWGTVAIAAGGGLIVGVGIGAIGAAFIIAAIK